MWFRDRVNQWKSTWQICFRLPLLYSRGSQGVCGCGRLGGNVGWAGKHLPFNPCYHEFRRVLKVGLVSSDCSGSPVRDECTMGAAACGHEPMPHAARAEPAEASPRDQADN